MTYCTIFDFKYLEIEIQIGIQIQIEIHGSIDTWIDRYMNR